MNKTSGIITLC